MEYRGFERISETDADINHIVCINQNWPVTHNSWNYLEHARPNDGIIYIKTGQAVYTMTDGRELSTDSGDVLYLPGDTIERLFGIEVSVSVARLELSTDKLAVISGGANYYELNYDAELLYWLPQIINAEAKFEPLAGQIGVGNVVMNRLSSPDFPDTIFEVIYDTEHTIQFEPISTGGIFMEPTEQATIAAYLCLEGCSTVGDCLYFVNPDYGSGWFDSSLELVETIGHHNFYK